MHAASLVAIADELGAVAVVFEGRYTHEPEETLRAASPLEGERVECRAQRAKRHRVLTMLPALPPTPLVTLERLMHATRKGPRVLANRTFSRSGF